MLSTPLSARICPGHLRRAAVASIALRTLDAPGFGAGNPASTESNEHGFLRRINLFEGGVGGYARYRIPGIAITDRGTVPGIANHNRSLTLAHFNLEWLTGGRDRLPRFNR